MPLGGGESGMETTDTRCSPHTQTQTRGHQQQEEASIASGARHTELGAEETTGRKEKATL